MWSKVTGFARVAAIDLRPALSGVFHAVEKVSVERRRRTGERVAEARQRRRGDAADEFAAGRPSARSMSESLASVPSSAVPVSDDRASGGSVNWPAQLPRRPSGRRDITKFSKCSIDFAPKGVEQVERQCASSPWCEIALAPLSEMEIATKPKGFRAPPASLVHLVDLEVERGERPRRELHSSGRDFVRELSSSRAVHGVAAVEAQLHAGDPAGLVGLQRLREPDVVGGDRLVEDEVHALVAGGNRAVDEPRRPVAAAVELERRAGPQMPGCRTWRARI